jgi:hypothetical protein
MGVEQRCRSVHIAARIAGIWHRSRAAYRVMLMWLHPVLPVVFRYDSSSHP